MKKKKQTFVFAIEMNLVNFKNKHPKVFFGTQRNGHFLWIFHFLNYNFISKWIQSGTVQCLYTILVYRN